MDDNDDVMSSANGRVIGRDISYIREDVTDIKSDMKELRKEAREHIALCNECRRQTGVELATVKEQIRQGDRLSTAISAGFATIAGVLSTFLKGGP